MSFETTEGNEIEITAKDMIVSTTDRKGTIIYANDIFCNVAGYTRDEVIGKPHNMIRHPKMPKVVFKLLWERVLKGEVIYAFVKNQSKNGDYYWVKAYVKPIIENGEVVKITSYRKPLNDFAKSYIIKLYDVLLDYEKTHNVDETYQFLENYLKERDLTYDQFIDRLSLQKSVENISLRNINYNRQKNSHYVYTQFVKSCVETQQFEELEKKEHEVFEFSKWCDEVKNESFANDEKWKELIKCHDKFHSTIDAFIQKAKEDNTVNNLESMISDLDCNINNIFENLTTIRDRY